MSAGRSWRGVIVGIGPGAMDLVGVQCARGRVEVTGVHREARPGDVSLDDAAAVGGWLRDALRASDLRSDAKRGGVIFGVPRGEVVLKRLALPGELDEAELPETIRLQMTRQMAVASDEAAIDFLPMEEDAAGASSAERGVLASALEASRVDWYRGVAREASVKVRGLSLRSLGLASIVAGSSARLDGAVLAIAPGEDRIEFVVVEGGRLVFAREAEVEGDAVEGAEGVGGGGSGAADRIAVDAKRTWMTYRVMPTSLDIESVLVLGDDERGRAIADRCERALELPVSTLEAPPSVGGLRGLKASVWGRVSPLVGIAIDRATDRAQLDFASPRRAPDAAAAARQRMLVAALLCLVVLGTLFTFARMDLKKREARVEELSDEWGSLSKQAQSYVRKQARLDHVERWLDAGTELLGHLEALDATLPPRGEVLLSEISTYSVAEVEYTGAPRKAYERGAWDVRTGASFVIEGSAKDRTIADALRASLVRDERYTVETRGADSGEKFGFSVRTGITDPRDAEEPDDEQSDKQDETGEGDDQ